MDITPQQKNNAHCLNDSEFLTLNVCGHFSDSVLLLAPQGDLRPHLALFCHWVANRSVRTVQL